LTPYFPFTNGRLTKNVTTRPYTAAGLRVNTSWTCKTESKMEIYICQELAWARVFSRFLNNFGIDL
jgi:hypothetical protein